MSLPLEILEATTPEQIDHVRFLIRDYQALLPVPIRFPDQEWLDLPGQYSAPQGALLLATIDGQPAGCVGLRPFPLAGACEMKRLYVRPAFRGDKLGSALVERVINVARRIGYRRLRLDTHPHTMHAAVELYRRFGFQEVSAKPIHHVEGLSYLELRL